MISKNSHGLSGSNLKKYIKFAKKKSLPTGGIGIPLYNIYRKKIVCVYTCKCLSYMQIYIHIYSYTFSHAYTEAFSQGLLYFNGSQTHRM